MRKPDPADTFGRGGQRERGDRPDIEEFIPAHAKKIVQERTHEGQRKKVNFFRLLLGSSAAEPPRPRAGPSEPSEQLEERQELEP